MTDLRITGVGAGIKDADRTRHQLHVRCVGDPHAAHRVSATIGRIKDADAFTFDAGGENGKHGGTLAFNGHGCFELEL
ncbi:MAG: hypothetical protein ACK56F_24500, partial [bacterium]